MHPEQSMSACSVPEVASRLHCHVFSLICVFCILVTLYFTCICVLRHSCLYEWGPSLATYLSAQEEYQTLKTELQPHGHFPTLNIDCILHIFHLLDAAAVCACARTCKLWHQLSRSKQLWRHVSLKDNRILSWPMAVELFNAMGTVSIDLRGIETLPSNLSGMALLSRVPTLSRLGLPALPFHHVSAITTSLNKNLHTLVLDGLGEKEITCDSKGAALKESGCVEFDFTDLAHLKALESLAIASEAGLAIPAFSFGCGSTSVFIFHFHFLLGTPLHK
jgi:hypothetical protein